ncbi:MAG: hypothetical protein FD129_1217, partial [bacterium]
MNRTYSMLGRSVGMILAAGVLVL